MRQTGNETSKHQINIASVGCRGTPGVVTHPVPTKTGCGCAASSTGCRKTPGPHPLQEYSRQVSAIVQNAAAVAGKVCMLDQARAAVAWKVCMLDHAIAP